MVLSLLAVAASHVQRARNINVVLNTDCKIYASFVFFA